MSPLRPLALAALLSATLPAFAADKAPGTVFKDCKNCPEMVVLPAGSFIMGTPESEVGRQPDEGPQHQVTFARPFAISRYQVTAAELDAYLKATGVRLADGDTRPGRQCLAGKPRYQQGPRQPAVCVSYQDVVDYAAWLSRTTGQRYRMLSEAEREYGARAGSTGAFPFTHGPRPQLQHRQARQHLRRQRRLQRHFAGRELSAQRLRRLRHARQRLRMGRRLLARPLPGRSHRWQCLDRRSPLRAGTNSRQRLG
ncbi:formylglycine-generating enzyme required for sulfatase activity [Pseudomonas psychrotolerans]|nr:formylglycine-generating enzyme required for sulfatase activity [Pseudomonas psychrotolerans]